MIFKSYLVTTLYLRDDLEWPLNSRKNWPLYSRLWHFVCLVCLLLLARFCLLRRSLAGWADFGQPVWEGWRSANGLWGGTVCWKLRQTRCKSKMHRSSLVVKILFTFADIHLNLMENFHFVKIGLFLNLVSRKKNSMEIK